MYGFYAPIFGNFRFQRSLRLQVASQLSATSSGTLLDPPEITVEAPTFDDVLVPVCPQPQSAHRRWSARIPRKLPMGGLLACLLIGFIHIILALWVFPEPVARATLRHKVIKVVAA